MDAAGQLLQNIVADADKIAEEQTSLDFGGSTYSRGDGGESHPDIQVSDEAYRDFYQGYRQIVKEHIPKSSIRDAIWKLAGLFLREGKVKRADCRFATKTNRKRLNKVAYDWLVDTNGKDFSNLLQRLVELNRSHGHDPTLALRQVKA